LGGGKPTELPFRRSKTFPASTAALIPEIGTQNIVDKHLVIEMM
jgi:hypothetical protein